MLGRVLNLCVKATNHGRLYVLFVSLHAGMGITEEKCYEMFHILKLSLSLLNLLKDIPIQYQ